MSTTTHERSDRMSKQGSTTLRSGADYIASIKEDGRSIFVDGELVRDVTTHPAFRGAVESVARLYDIASNPEERELMTYTSPSSGNPVLRCYQIPRSAQDLAARRLMSQRWAEATCGLMGRSPDHVAGFLAGFAARPEVFAQGGQQFADNVTRFYEFARENHLYSAYAIVPPQIDRSKPAHQQSDPTLYAGVVKERDDGVVLKGAQQLATGTVLADYVYLSCIHPLQPGDEAYATGVMIPMNAPGLKVYTRRSFARNVESTFDYPLSSRFDETDSLVVLDNVFVPWENVFIHRNLAVCRDQWWRTPAHAYGNHQAQVRYSTKLRFMLGLTKRINELTGNDSLPPVQVQMGELAAMATIVESMVLAQEAMATTDPDGVVWPAKTALYAVMALQSQINPKMIDIVRELSGGSMIMLPSSYRDYGNPEIAADMERYVASPGSTSKERVALMKMAWDLIGTEFAGRHQQYEKFYGGASFLIKQNMNRCYDFERAKKLVDAVIQLPERTFDLPR
ncbi:4-hydroxyphenylacetate 3-monooxygenase, oxygenase component [Burkholderia sp. OK233]|nr:4-hydroxyphenylacetate 3-monooxygenase, oxygenase component [Burkholderia sp. OK233]